MTGRTVICAYLLLATLVSDTASAQREAPTRVFALIVANNHSLDRSVPSLRYADDDAARFYELMATLGAETQLLTVLDAETQLTFGGLSQVARPPTQAEV